METPYSLRRDENRILKAMVSGKEIPLSPPPRKESKGTTRLPDWRMAKGINDLPDGIRYPIEITFHSGYGNNYRIIKNPSELDIWSGEMETEVYFHFRELNFFGRRYLASRPPRGKKVAHAVGFPCAPLRDAFQQL